MNNRIIKFRIWDLKNKKWENNIGLYFDNSHLADLSECFHNDIGENNGNNYIIQQFTGLLDKNGKEIYEGDIIQDFDFDKPKGNLLVIKYGKAYSVYAFSPYDIQNEDFFDFYGGWPIEFIYIGNIFENPELLNKYERKY